MIRKTTSKQKFIPFVIILLITIQLSVSIYSNTPIIASESTLAVMNTFPVDMDLLFWADNPSVQADRLNTIGNYSNGWIVSPWGAHFVSNHIEGADKWYLYCGRHLDVYAPTEGDFIHDLSVGNGTVDNINGHDVVIDIGITIGLEYACGVGFGHINLLKSIYDQIINSNDYHFTEGELIGVTPYPWAMDFYYYAGSNFQSICPYAALSTTLQNQINHYYGLQYERAIISGLHPESHMCNPFDININDSIWGTWQYYSGPYNSYFDSDSWYGEYQAGFITLLRRDLTTTETFYRDPRDPTNQNLTENILGIFGDCNGQDIPEYQKTGDSLVTVLEGTQKDGILGIITYSYAEWGYNTTIYTKVLLEENNFGYFDDMLTIEYFPTLEEAQSGFTTNNITYSRFIPYWINEPTTTTKQFGLNSWFLLYVVMIPIVVISYKKRK
ncbi:MAG: hypothetical protein FK734_08365 [Asgard group archaeon]|nr:hypothetical protein [Asgard group archaeon]